MKPTTRQARKIINKFLKDNNTYHIGTWTDKRPVRSGTTPDRYVAYRTFNKGVNYEATKFLNELWPCCANVTGNQYIRVKCTLA